jgi:hypothetical protein
MGDENDIVYLNVGGTKMATKRSTLCQIEGSLLASLFSGRWEDNVERDVDGHAFLDFNPKLFALVLDYLRAKKIETPSKPVLLPPVALEDTVNFRSLVDYLGVEQTIQNNTQASGRSIDEGIKHQFEFHSEGIVLQENGTAAMHKMGTDRHEFVIGKDTNGPWRLCLQSVKQSSDVFVGLLNTESRDDCISQSLIQRADNIFMSPSTWTGSYGWVLGENSQTCSNGKASPTPNYGTLGKQGDTIELQAISCQLRCPKRWESFTAFATIWSEIVNDYDTILTKRSKLAVFDCTVCIIQVTA